MSVLLNVCFISFASHATHDGDCRVAVSDNSRAGDKASTPLSSPEALVFEKVPS